MPSNCMSLFTRIVLIVIYLSISSKGYTQPTNDTITAFQHFSKAEVLLHDWKLDSTLIHFKKALSLYEQNNFRKRVADTHDKIAEVYRKNYDLNDALVHAKKALSIRLKIFNPKHSEIANSYNSIGHIFKDQDNYTSAMEYYQRALTININTFGNSNYKIGDDYHNIGSINLLIAEYDKAIKLYTKGFKIRKNIFGNEHQKVADSYIDLGLAYYYSGKYKKGLNYCKKALKIRELIFGELSPEVAFCHNYIGDILNYLQQFDESFKHQKKALSIISSKFDTSHPNISFCYASIGILYQRRDKYDLALQYNKKALSILINKVGEKHFKVCYLYNVIGMIYAKKGQYDESLKYFINSLVVAKKIYSKENHYLGSRYNNIGVIYKYKGEYDKALQYYKNANLIDKRSKTYFNIANIYKTLEKYDLAHLFYKKALKMTISTWGENHIDIPYFYLEFGHLQILKKDYYSALLYYQKALSIQKNIFGEQHYHVCDIYDKIAKLHLKKKEFIEAKKYFEKSIQIRLKTDGKHHPRTAKSYNLIADLHFITNTYEKAIYYYKEAITANTNPNKTKADNKSNLNQYFDPNILLESLYGQAQSYQKQFTKNNQVSDLVASIEVYKKADTLIQNIRETIRNYQDKLTFTKLTKKIYTGAIQTQLSSYQTTQKTTSLERAFYYTEKSKANTLYELLNTSNAKNFAGLPSKILEIEQNLKANHSLYTSEILNEHNTQTPDSVKIISYENKLFTVERQQDSLNQIIEKKYPKYHLLTHKKGIITVSDVQKKLNSNTTFIEFFTTDNTIYAFVISKNDIIVKEIQISKLNQKIEKLHRYITTSYLKEYKNSAHTLYKELLLPIADQLKGDQLIIAPDGPLWHLNFELLLTQNDVSENPKEFSYFLKDYAVSYANSANLLFSSFNEESSQSKVLKECLAFSFSDSINLKTSKSMSLAMLRNAKEDLPGTRKEIRAISNLINGQYYYGSEAIETNFKKNADKYNILHLALHGEVDNKHPENSRLYFTKSKDSLEDNLLYSHELFALDIPAELTVLSACNTGSGKIAKGEGIMSLGNAFQYAGTKSLVLSSWEVSDKTTPELMKHFYSNLKKGMSKAKALRQAKLQYLTTAETFTSSPFYWGGFYLVGDPSPITFKKDLTLYWVIGLGILITSIFAMLWYRKQRKN